MLLSISIPIPVTWARREMLTLTHTVTALLPQRAQTQHTLFTARTVPIWWPALAQLLKNINIAASKRYKNLPSKEWAMKEKSKKAKRPASMMSILHLITQTICSHREQKQRYFTSLILRWKNKIHKNDIRNSENIMSTCTDNRILHTGSGFTKKTAVHKN